MYKIYKMMMYRRNHFAFILFSFMRLSEISHKRKLYTFERAMYGKI